MEKAWRSVQRIHSGTGKQGLFLKKYNIFYPFEKKDLQTFIFSYILAIAVALIAVKREVVASLYGSEFFRGANVMFRYIREKNFLIYHKKTDGKSLYNNKMRKGEERRLQQIPRKGNV